MRSGLQRGAILPATSKAHPRSTSWGLLAVIRTRCWVAFLQMRESLGLSRIFYRRLGKCQFAGLANGWVQPPGGLQWAALDRITHNNEAFIEFEPR